MARLDGRVAIVTGAGRGLGREHALALAAEGAAVVVNDLGGDVHGTSGADATPAQEVVSEIEARGGRAVVSGHDVSDWEQAAELVELAVSTFGSLDVLINNAGILRDKTLANMAESDWDDVVRVHLKGHAAPTKHAVSYWKERSRSGETFDASVVMTSSIAGYGGNFGQANYSSVKLAMLALSRVVTLEAGRYGVRSNCVSPGARTRLSMSVPGAQDDPSLAVPAEGYDPHDPAHVSPLIVWLASEACPATAQVFHINGGRLLVSSMPPLLHEVELDHAWTLDELDKQLPALLVDPLSVERWAGLA